MNEIIRRRAVVAAQLRNGMLLNFDDNEPAIIDEVKHLAHKVLFNARGTQFCLDNDEMVQLVMIMRVVG